MKHLNAEETDHKFISVMTTRVWPCNECDNVKEVVHFSKNFC